MGNLIIIGNGFDLCHGKKTSYSSFAETLDTTLRNDWKKLLKEYSGDENNWTDFENEIGEITKNIFDEYLNSYTIYSSVHINTEDYQNLLRKSKEVFYKISNLLRIYLSDIQKQGIQPKKTLTKYFRNDSQVLSFNYTNFVTEYTDKEIKYIHGSVDDGYIVFGYSLRGEFDHIDPEATEFSKYKHRQLLHYHKFLKNEGIVEEQSLKNERSIYMTHLHQLSTGKGGWAFEYPEELIDNIIKYLIKENIIQAEVEYFGREFELRKLLPQRLKTLLDEARSIHSSEFMNKYYHQIEGKNFHNILNELNYNTINEIVIMGHSLGGDIEIFEDLSSRLKVLNNIILLIFDGEKICEIDKKIHRLESIFKTKELKIKIEIRNYND